MTRKEFEDILRQSASRGYYDQLMEEMLRGMQDAAGIPQSTNATKTRPEKPIYHPDKGWEHSASVYFLRNLRTVSRILSATTPSYEFCECCRTSLKSHLEIFNFRSKTFGGLWISTCKSCWTSQGSPLGPGLGSRFARKSLNDKIFTLQ